MLIELDKSVKLKPFQKEIIEKGTNYKKKYLVCTAARQTGKSFSLRLLCLKWLLEEDNQSIAYFALTNKMARYFFSLVAKIVPHEIVKHANASTCEIEIINGSKISFLSVEPTAVSNIRGLTLTHLIIDECAFMSQRTSDGQDIWNEILAPMTDFRAKKIVFISTPKGKQGLFYEMTLKCYTNKANFDFIKCSIYDDPTKTEDWIAQKKSEMPLKAWQQEYECLFLQSGASYFDHYEKNFKLSDDFQFKGTLYGGVDFSSAGEDATVVSIVDSIGQSKQWIIEGSLDSKYQQIAGIINAHSNLKEVWMENNSIGLLFINEIKKLVSRRSIIKEFNTNRTSKPDIIQQLATDIEKDNLTFLKSDQDLLHEFSVFTYTIKNNGNVSYAAMDGFHDDRVMSLAFANACKNKFNKSSGPHLMVVRG